MPPKEHDMPTTLPPWIHMLRAHADQPERDRTRRGTPNTARDIANSAHDDVMGNRTQTHRGVPRG